MLIAEVDDEVEVGPGFTEQEPPRVLVDPMTAQERDGRWRYPDRPTCSIRLGVEEQELAADPLE